jgi:hypothetical protein
MTNEVNIRDNKMDELEVAMLTNFPAIECPIRHYFTNDMYAREMSAPADSMITSKIHLSEHFFIVSKGSLIVWDDDGEEKFIEAPFIGITKQGTRRVAYIWSDCVWTTFHSRLENETAEQIEERIIDQRENPLLTEELKSRIINALNINLCHS